MKGFTGIAATAALLSASSVLATPTEPELVPRASSTSSGKTPQVTVKGNAFFAGNNRFYIRGVDYQPGGSSLLKDPIADATSCKRDIKNFVDLGLNTIRVYTVDNTADHDECMQALANAGIYLALDVNTPNYSLNRADPAPSYNDVYLQNIFATIDKFQKYDNTLLFFSGNEVINDNTTTPTAPYIKAVTRDMKSYIKSRGYRSVPVGYSGADVSDNRYETSKYMNCGTDDERSDFFAFNDYSWCDPSTYQQSGWDQKVALWGNYSIPLFLSEYGCNNVRPRAFNEVASLYSTQMTGVYSGGLVYEYSQEEHDFGLVQIGTDGTATPYSDYDNFKSKLAAAPAPTGDGGYKSNLQPMDCPPQSPTWNVKNNDLPAIPEPAKKYLTQGAGTGAGLSGSGSQNAGTPSSGTATPGSGTVSGSPGAKTSGSKSGASGLSSEFSMASFVIPGVLLMSTLFGAALL